MSSSYIEYGSPIENPSIGELTLPAAQAIFTACESSSCYEIIELRKLEGEEGLVAEIIVADCTCREIPSRNDVGILIRERIALTLMADETKMPEVRMLRNEFPTILHCNYVKEGDPVSLCLYFEPWSTVRRVWTPQQFLQRVEWWLTSAAQNSLHRTDQPLEPLYFDSPQKFVIPPKDALKNGPLKLLPLTKNYYRSAYENDISIGISIDNNIIPITVYFPPVIHGEIESFPSNLGEINDQIEKRGPIFSTKLFDAIREHVQENIDEKYVTKNPSENCLLILIIPVARNEDSEAEKIDVSGFFLGTDLASLGESLGALDRMEDYTPNRYYAIDILGVVEHTNSWRDFEVSPVEIIQENSFEFAQQGSGLNSELANFQGTLVGVGALGSTIVNIWSKEAWGKWTLIDADVINPHNIIRHLATDQLIGVNKAEAVAHLVDNNYYNMYSETVNLNKNVLDLLKDESDNTLETSDLLVDASTTLEVPRELSKSEKCPRSVSIFLTPSGNASVLLLEDSERKVRLNNLESQYYRAILNFPWGAAHLKNHKGHLAVGLGCRDVSLVMSYEKITLHSAILSQQVRILRDQTQPKLKIWISDDENSAVQVHDIPISPVICCTCGNWEMLLDDYLVKELNKIRQEKLPNETGGIILGYADHILKQIFIVDICPAPIDSDEKTCSFVRGCHELTEVVDSASDRTANVVGYIGEWHSHPRNYTAKPSAADQILIDDLSNTMWKEGRPVLMLIVGENSITITVKEGDQKWTVEI
ncbi:integrative and conjugative element protein, VC0181 family [Maridesulfovibrio ferrireducens]|uniref:Integrative and conjugative element protein, VC0181 family n=1 Tax=Maridesulfovibrio ferrireducens TaxID=246191 RepID=A0A1G9KVU5_9BACT|nr:ThiF family adenylyltransferase [Maridesulfovibrio ferrireducens]SDL53739.1 integrative and conjugative element protein, VC0181 family [Maridesulfovibrio ferrireducens]